MDSGFHALDSGFQKLNSVRFLMDFGIPRSVFRIPKLGFQIQRKDMKQFKGYSIGSCGSCSEEKSPIVRFPDPKQYWKQLEEWHVIVSHRPIRRDLPSSSYTTPSIALVFARSAYSMNSVFVFISVDIQILINRQWVKFHIAMFFSILFFTLPLWTELSTYMT